MWAGFVDADANGLSSRLVDDVSADTSAMRLKLALMGDTAVPSRAFKVAAVANGKARGP